MPQPYRGSRSGLRISTGTGSSSRPSAPNHPPQRPTPQGLHLRHRLSQHLGKEAAHAVRGLHQHIPVRHLSLSVPRRASDRQPDPLRSRALYVEERFLPDVAQARAAAGLEPLPLRRHHRDSRSLRRVSGATLGGGLGAEPGGSPASCHGGRRHRRPGCHHRPDHPAAPAPRRSAHPVEQPQMGYRRGHDAVAAARPRRAHGAALGVPHGWRPVRNTDELRQGRSSRSTAALPR